MYILLVENDNCTAYHIKKALREASHLADVVTDGKTGLYWSAGKTYDVVILSRTLPKMDGAAILKTMRAAGDKTPVIIMSAQNDVYDRVNLLRAGADDYLTKPFIVSELVARVEVVGRRGPARDEAQYVTIHDLSIDLLSQEIYRDQRPIKVTTLEFRILTYLARNAGRVVTRSMLLDNIWGYNFHPQTNIVDQHISRLRQKVDQPFKTSLIETVRGTGYKMRKT